MCHIILHRGLYRGKDYSSENNPWHLSDMLNDYDCEIDLWRVEKKLYLGHDNPKYLINFDWLVDYRDKLWIHAKNSSALNFLNNQIISLNYFWHENDKHVLTSRGFIWQAFHYKGLTNKTVIVDISRHPDYNAKCYALCVDYIK